MPVFGERNQVLEIAQIHGSPQPTGSHQQIRNFNRFPLWLGW
jgi:hypothetical protein